MNENSSKIYSMAGWMIDWSALLLVLLLIIYSHTTTKYYVSLFIYFSVAAKFTQKKRNQIENGEKESENGESKFSTAIKFLYGTNLTVAVRYTMTHRENHN